MTPSIARRRRTAVPALAVVFAVAAALAVALPARAARADETIRIPGAHPDYHFEIEPHLTFGDYDTYASAGYGVGVRFGIPIVRNGFVPQINNSVAINFGLDLVHYDACYFDNVGCGANYLLFPVALQWNFFFTHKWSAFGEGGLFLYKGWVSDDLCHGLGAVGCSEPSDFGALPMFAVGGRYHLTDDVSLVLRVGYPTITFGVSFW
jgi:hypothetical protein